MVVKVGQAAIIHAGEWIQYSNPEGAVYISGCIPAFPHESVHKNQE